MRTIAISTGLLQMLSDDEIRALLAHELHHWRSGDAVGSRLVWSSAWPIAADAQHREGHHQVRLTRAAKTYWGVHDVPRFLVAWPAWVI